MAYLNSTATDICIAPTDKSRVTMSMFFVNTDTLTHTVDIYTLSDTNDLSYILKNWAIPAGDTMAFDANEKIKLLPNCKLIAKADSANLVTYFVSYIDM